MMLAPLLGIASNTTGRIAIQSNAGWEMLVRRVLVYICAMGFMIGGECAWMGVCLVRCCADGACAHVSVKLALVVSVCSTG